jgi:hypothetical protein
MQEEDAQEIYIYIYTYGLRRHTDVLVLAGVFGRRGNIRKKMNMRCVVLCIQGWDGSWMRWEEGCSISAGERVSVGVRVHASGIGIGIATRAVVSEPLTPKPKTELETEKK